MLTAGSYNQGIPEETEVAIPVSRLPSNQASSQGTNTITEMNPAGAAPLSGLPNSSPLNMFPQVKYCSVFVLTHISFKGIMSLLHINSPD